MTRRTLLSVVIATVAVARPATAQSVERNFERLAESIAAAAERMASRVERHATSLASRIEAEFERQGRLRDRDDDDRSDRQLEHQAQRIDTTFAFSGTGVIDVSSAFGDIVVTGWERREARIKASTGRGRLEYELSSSRIIIEQRSGGRTDRDIDSRYEISIPRGARLILHSTSGDIEVRNAGGEVEVSSTSGDVTVAGSSGRVDANTVSGDLTLRDIKGDVDGNTVSGSIEATGLEGDIHLGSTSGDLFVSDARGRDVELSTTSGEVSYAGTVDANGRYEFNSHSGTINLAIPAGTNARFSVETFSGEIDSDFPITLQPGDRSSSRPRRFEFNLGAGGPRIIAESFSGDVEIRKR